MGSHSYPWLDSDVRTSAGTRLPYCIVVRLTGLDSSFYLGNDLDDCYLLETLRPRYGSDGLPLANLYVQVDWQGEIA